MAVKMDKKIFLNIILVLLLLVIGGYSIYQNFSENVEDPLETTEMPGRTKYVIPPDKTVLLFGVEADEFREDYFSTYENVEDPHTYLQRDVDGNLIIYLSEEQKNAYLQFGAGSVETARELGVIVSEDYTQIKIVCYAEEMKNYAYKKPLLLEHNLVRRQFIAGKDPKLITVEVIIQDKATDEVIYQATMPPDTIYYCATFEKYKEMSK